MGLKRVSHYLKGNKTSAYPSDFIYFDAETTPVTRDNGDIDQPFKLGVGLYWRRRPDRSLDTLEYIRFTNIAKFWKFVDDKALPKRKLILIAHNLQFDFMVLGGFSYLRRKGYDLTGLITNGKTNIFSYKKNSKTILCLDNMNYFNTSIKSLGETVGLAKLDMPADGSPKRDWFEYCQRDVDIMHRAWLSWLGFLRDNDLGTFGKTLASQAFNAFRHRFMDAEILVSINKRATEISRNSYRGGRVECFKLGPLPDQEYFMLDINSMYPYCMKAYDYPVKLLYIKSEPSIAFLTKALSTKCVIADVLVETDEPIFGVRHNHRLTFPTGTFRVTLTSNELRKAIELNAIRSIYQICVYQRANIFSSFVDYFYQKRLDFQTDKQPAYSYLCKIMLNSLYGKFGQRNEEWVFVGVEPEPVDYVITEIDAQTGRRYTVRCIAGQICETRYHVEGYNSFPAISSEVTANARMLLWQFMEAAGRENVFYCDTDSLLVNRSGYERLSDTISHSDLGKLKLAQSSNKVTLHNVKDYVIGNVTKIKGVSKSAKKVNDNEYITYQQQGVRAALRNNRVNAMTWSRVPKKLHRIYEKGVVIHQTDVHPLIMTYSLDANWLDYERMIELYGDYASIGDKYIDAVMHFTEVYTTQAAGGDQDYRPSDKMQKIIDNIEARRRGEMIYQRRKG